MGGGCTCHSDLKKYFYSSGEFIINSEYHNKNNSNNKIPEKNMSLIKKDFENIYNNKSNYAKNSDKTKNESKNNISNDTNKKNQNISNNNENKKKRTSFNPNNNSSFYMSENSKKNDFKNNINNNQKEYSINSNNIINEINSNTNSPNSKVIQKKLIIKDDMELKKADTNFNCNLGEHNFIYINVKGRKSIINNEYKEFETGTPKMSKTNNNLEDIIKGNNRIFTHFCPDIKSNEKQSKNQSSTHNIVIVKEEKETVNINLYMSNYPIEMLNVINSIRKNPQSFLQYIDEVLNNNIQRNNDDIYIVSKIFEEKIKITEDFLEIFEELKTNINEIINNQNISLLEDFKYNKELEISFDKLKEIINKENNNESSIINDKCVSHIIINNNEIDNNNNDYTLNLSDEIIAYLILEKRKQIKDKFPENIFKMSLIRDIKVNILTQISMELFYNKNQNKDKLMLNNIIFNPKYRNFAVGWIYEVNKKFISIYCFA